MIDSGFGEYQNSIFNDFGEMIDELKNRDAFINKEAFFNFSYTPYPDEYDLIFKTAWDLGNLTILLEESDRFDETIPSFLEIIVRGRHKGVSIIAVAPHPYNFPKDLRRQLTDIISFRQTEESDLDYLSDAMGPEIYKVRDFPVGSHNRLEWKAGEGVKFY